MAGAAKLAFAVGEPTAFRSGVEVLEANMPATKATLGDVARFLKVAEAWPNMTLETRRAIVDALVTGIRFASRETELVIRPELRPMIAAIAAPAIWTTRTGVVLWTRLDSGQRDTPPG